MKNVKISNITENAAPKSFSYDDKILLEKLTNDTVQALKDYIGHTNFDGFAVLAPSYKESIEPIVSAIENWQKPDSMVHRVVIDNIVNKRQLRNAFRRLDEWDEDRNALVIRITENKGRDMDTIRELVDEIFKGADVKNGRWVESKVVDYDTPIEIDGREYLGFRDLINPDGNIAIKASEIVCAEEYFCFAEDYYMDDCYISDRDYGLYCINKIAKFFNPSLRDFKKGMKYSKVFAGFCKQIGVFSENSGVYQQKSTALYNEIKEKTEERVMLLSINPAHYITMSNPHISKEITDICGKKQMLVSCHSLDSGYVYNGGCVGYATDSSSMILFTTADINDLHSLNNRKVSRQMIFFNQDNNVLVQSRLYDANGGTSEYSPISEANIKAVINILAKAMNISNNIGDWDIMNYAEAKAEKIFKARETKVFKNGENIFDPIYTNKGFVGYPDWLWFPAKVAILKNENYNSDEPLAPITVGNVPVCFGCGGTINISTEHRTDNFAPGILCEHCRCEILGIPDWSNVDFGNDDFGDIDFDDDIYDSNDIGFYNSDAYDPCIHLDPHVNEICARINRINNDIYDLDHQEDDGHEDDFTCGYLLEQLHEEEALLEEYRYNILVPVFYNSSSRLGIMNNNGTIFDNVFDGTFGIYAVRFFVQLKSNRTSNYYHALRRIAHVLDPDAQDYNSLFEIDSLIDERMNDHPTFDWDTQREYAEESVLRNLDDTILGEMFFDFAKKAGVYQPENEDLHKAFLAALESIFDLTAECIPMFEQSLESRSEWTVYDPDYDALDNEDWSEWIPF